MGERFKSATSCQEDVERPGIGDDVVDLEQQNVLGRCQPQRHPQQRSLREIEGAAGLGQGEPLGLGLPAGGRQAAEIGQRQSDLEPGPHLLIGLPILGVEGGPQGLCRRTTSPRTRLSTPVSRSPARRRDEGMT